MNSFQRVSQESKVTSTPRHGSPATASLSPSISSIEHEEVSMEFTCIGDEAEESSTTYERSSFLNESVAEESSQTKLSAAGNIRWVGFWSSLKPVNKESLYYKVTMHPEEIDSIAIDICNVYTNNEKQGTLLLLQFFVDLCGYKRLQIGKVYNFEETNSKSVVDQMESDLMEPELKKHQKFLFMKCSLFERSIDNIITTFLKRFVLSLFKTKILFKDGLISHVFDFLNNMSFSQVRCVRVTGLILVFKLLSAFIELYHEFITDMQDVNSNNVDESVEELKSSIENSIDFLFLIFNKNCLLPDRKCYPVKVKWIEEMYLWIKLFPDIFIIRRRCLGRLVNVIIDVNETVRSTALTTFKKLIATEEIQHVVSQRIELILSVTIKRIVDVNSKVATKAIGILTVALEKYFEVVTKSQVLHIIRRMIEKNPTVANAAGKFLSKYLRILHDNNEEEILKSLVKYAYYDSDSAERVCFFLQSCEEYFPELKNWNLVVTILLNNEIDFKLRKCLVRIFNETIRHKLTGKFSLAREIVFRVYKTNSDDHINITTVIIPNYEDLMVNFQTDKACLKQLTEILTFVNYECSRAEISPEHLTVVLRLLRDLFNSSIDKGLLEVVASASHIFSEKLYHNRTHVIIEVITNNCVQELIDDLRQLSSSSNKSLFAKLRLNSMKSSILFEKFDLTKILKWEEIFNVWDNKHLKITKYLFVCCKWHLVWSLRHFIRASTNENDAEPVNHLLYSNCKDFVSGCLTVLKYATDKSEFFLVFETLCDLYVIFQKELVRKRQFSRFMIPITDPDYIETLFNFVTRYVIENNKLLLDERRRYLIQIVHVMNFEVLPLEQFSKIFRFYYSHFNEFGSIMNQIVKDLLYFSPMTLSLVIMHTLTEFYTQILGKFPVYNRHSDEAKQLKMLAKKFATAKEVKLSGDVLKLVNMTIDYAFRSEQNYPFLLYARYFVSGLSPEEKNDAYDIFKEMVPEKDNSNEILLIFASALKSYK